MDNDLLSKSKLIDWLEEKIESYFLAYHNSYSDYDQGREASYHEVIESVRSGLFDPDPIPLPTINPGDTKTIKFHCRECDFECVVQYDSEVFVDIDKGHCPHCGNSDAVDLEVSHD